MREQFMRNLTKQSINSISIVNELKHWRPRFIFGPKMHMLLLDQCFPLRFPFPLNNDRYDILIQTDEMFAKLNIWF